MNEQSPNFCSVLLKERKKEGKTRLAVLVNRVSSILCCRVEGYSVWLHAYRPANSLLLTSFMQPAEKHQKFNFILACKYGKILC